MTKGSTKAFAAYGISAVSFGEFLEGWLVRQEHYLDELVSAMQYCHESRDDDLKDLTNRVLSHYQQYYEEKSRLAQRNIFLLFCPPWFTSFERSFLWIGGFKPAMALGIVHEAVNDMSSEQSERMTRLTEETRLEERMLNDELARIQESTAAPPLLELARLRGRLGNFNGVRAEEAGAALETLRSGLETVVASADMLRTNTVMKVVETLSPVQTLSFLVAATQLQLKIRRWGLQNDMP